MSEHLEDPTKHLSSDKLLFLNSMECKTSRIFQSNSMCLSVRNISFPKYLCQCLGHVSFSGPFAQRTWIALIEKQVQYSKVDINLRNDAGESTPSRQGLCSFYSDAFVPQFWLSVQVNTHLRTSPNGSYDSIQMERCASFLLITYSARHLTSTDMTIFCYRCPCLHMRKREQSTRCITHLYT